MILKILPTNVVFFYYVFINYTFLYTDNTWMILKLAIPVVCI